jgi:hypothetical protein
VDEESGEKRKSKSEDVKKPEAKKRKKDSETDKPIKPAHKDPDVFYLGHPDGAVEEMIAFTNPALMVSTEEMQTAPAGDDEDPGEFTSHDELPQYRMTQFTFYDEESKVRYMNP